MAKSAGIVLAIALLAIAPQAAAQKDHWKPDSALVSQVETALRAAPADGLLDPGRHPVAMPAPFDSYTRTYAGETPNGERIVVGVLTLPDIGGGKAGIVTLDALDRLPQISGGGCGVVVIWYHVATQKLERLCNFAE